MKKVLSIIFAICLLVSSFSFCATYVSAYMPGDLNNDRKISAADSNMLIQAITGKSGISVLANKMGDFNADTKVNSADLNLLKKYFVGQYSIDDNISINEINICGKDISEYVIELPKDADECMQYAAETLQKHIKDASGINLDIVSDSNGTYAIKLLKDTTAVSDTEPGVLETEAYHIYTDNKDIIIEGGIYSGCMHGVYDFLYDYLGYRYYYKNGVASSNKMDAAERFVYKSDTIEITSIDKTHYPAIDIRRINAGGNRGYSSPALAGNYQYSNQSLAITRYGIYGQNTGTCHGIGQLFTEAEFNEKNSGYKFDRQPCFSTATMINETAARALKVLDAKYNSGQIPGKDFCGIDVSQIDTPYFCNCRLCYKLTRDNGSVSATVVNFGNEVSKIIQERDEYKDKINVNVFAYYGTEKAPQVIKPDKMVSISFCFYPSGSGQRPCNGHPINDPNCEFNTYFRTEFEKWCELTDNICVWYYPLTGRFLANTSIYIFNLYDDIKYLSEMGVYEIFVCNDYSNDTFDNLSSYLLQRLTWNCDITRDEYYEMIKEALNLMYGESGTYIWEYLCFMEKMSDSTNGQNGKGCFFSYISAPMIELDLSLMKENSEEMLDLWYKATECADEEHEYYVRQLMISSLYLYSCVNHTSMWLNGTEADKAKYKEILDYYIANAKKYNSPIIYYMNSAGKSCVDPNMTVDYDINPWEIMLDELKKAPGGDQVTDGALNFFGWNSNYNY